jgi:tRNA A37 threonylcarbamoyladenosine dehydratase
MTIDSLEHKADLIVNATRTKATFFSSMGAALKLDPSRIRTAEFRQVQSCHLAAALRRKLKKGVMPEKNSFAFSAMKCSRIKECMSSHKPGYNPYGMKEKPG